MRRTLILVVTLVGCNDRTITIGEVAPLPDLATPAPVLDLSVSVPDMTIHRPSPVPVPYIPPSDRPKPPDLGGEVPGVPWFIESQAVPPPAGTGTMIALGDFNRDGKLDVATAGKAYLGNGDGTLGVGLPYQSYTAFNNRPDVVVAADFDGDGVLDLYTGCDNGPALEVAFGNGDGTFRSPGACLDGFAEFTFVTDLNGDGKLDIVSSRSDLITPTFGTTNIYALLGSGDGTFSKRVLRAGNMVTVADFDGDGKPDLFGSCTTPTGTAAILLGVGDGSFADGNCGLPYAGPSLPIDLDGDGRLDMVIASWSDYSFPPVTKEGLTVFHGVTGVEFDKRSGYALGHSPTLPVAADFDGDGKIDLISADLGTPMLSLLLGHGDGTFDAPLPIAVGGQLYDVVSGDFDGDGRPDLVVRGTPTTPPQYWPCGFSIWLNRH